MRPDEIPKGEIVTLDLDAIFGTTAPDSAAPSAPGSLPDRKEELLEIPVGDTLAATSPAIPAASSASDFSDWVLRPDARGRLGWEVPGLPEMERWWAVAAFDEMPEPGEWWHEQTAAGGIFD